jgi:hypothetical protein
VLLVCTVYNVLHSKTALSGKPFGMDTCTYTVSLLRMTDTLTSYNINLSSWAILYTCNLRGGKGWRTCKADNLTAICEPIV